MTRVQELYPDSKIILREVGLRDGLQLVKTFPSTDAKQRWMRDEYAAGVRHFEVGSFLPAKTFPQFADVRDMIRTVASLPGAYGIALTLNERGVNEALASGVAEVATVVSATEEHSQANANRSRESAIANVRRLCELRDASAHKPVVNSAISMALGCSIVGAVDPKEVLRLTEKLFEAGVDMVAIADTVGYAGPKQVGELTAAAVKIAGTKPICIHLHDTRGMGIANASAALDAGARVLDGSLGGLGGCPFAPGATGNVVFEDLVFLCESKEFATGIDIEKLIAVRAILKSEMPGEALYGGLARAGLPGGEGGVRASESPVSRTRCSVKRCAAEPGPTATWTPDQQRTTPQAARCAASGERAQLQPRDPQPQRVADDAYRRQRHRRGRDDRRQQQAERGIENACGDRDAGGVVDEGEEQVLADIAHGRLREPPGADDADQIAFQQRDACAFHRNVSARSHGNADFSRRERRRVVDAVAGHRDDPAGLLQFCHHRALLVGQHFRLDVGDAEAFCDGVRRGPVVAGQHDDLDALGRQRFERIRRRRLHGVRNGEQACQLAVDRHVDHGRALAAQTLALIVQ